MLLIHVGQQDGVLLVVAERGVEVEALGEGYRRIRGPVHDENRRRGLGRVRERRLEMINLWFVPRGEAPTALPIQVVVETILPRGAGRGLIRPPPALGEVAIQVRYASADAHG